MTGSSKRSRSRHGLSLIEFLAVLAIISVFLLMMIPAILNARMAAKRSQCINNLKQVVLALHNYQDAHLALPPGVVNPSGPIKDPGPDPTVRYSDTQIGWIIQILPHLEQAMVWQSCDTKLPVYSDFNSTARRTQINSLLCPVDQPTNFYFTPPVPTPPTIGKSSYAGCHHDTESPIDVANRGVLYLNSHIRQQDIYDGTSTTIYVAEKVLDENDLGWMSGTRATLRNTGSPLNGKPGDNSKDPLHVGGFSSKHPGGVNAGFGDGSIHFIHETIAPGVLQNLGNRDDGEIVEDVHF